VSDFILEMCPNDFYHIKTGNSAWFVAGKEHWSQEKDKNFVE
jgi:hypothetical protein